MPSEIIERYEIGKAVLLEKSGHPYSRQFRRRIIVTKSEETNAVSVWNLEARGALHFKLEAGLRKRFEEK